MRPMSAEEVEAILRRNGFIRKSSKGGHMKWLNPATHRTAIVPQHGARIIPQGTLKSIFRQAGIEPPKR